jgi:hypothetical protein
LFFISAFARLCRPKSSLNYKKMRSDIAASIRQGKLSYRTHGTMLMDQDIAQENGDNDDADDEDEINGDVNDFQSRVPTSEIVDDSSSDEEE